MRTWLAFALAALAACSAPPEQGFEALEVNIEAAPNGLYLHVAEPARDCECPWGEFAYPGTCVFRDDVRDCGCEPGPGSCIDELRVERDGEMVAYFEDIDDVGWHLASVRGMALAAHTVVIDGCGEVVRIDIDPQPEIEGTINAVTLVGEDLVVDWHSRPATNRGLISRSIGFGVKECFADDNTFVLEGAGTYYEPGDEIWLGVTPFVTSEHMTSRLGPVHVWYGSGRSQQVAIREPVSND